MHILTSLFVILSLAKAADLPVCPSGTTILDESYPAQAVVISDVANKGYEGDKLSLVKKFIPEVLNSSNAKILFVAKTVNYESVVQDLTAEQKKRVLRLRKIPLTNWVQDPWVVQFDVKTGKPILLPLQKYSGAFDANKLVQSVKALLEPDLSTSIGKDLAALGKGEALGGQYGGNVLALGSFCFVGSSTLKDKFDSYAQQVCGTKANIIKVPTSFLNVGHADEVMKALPLKTKTDTKGTCSMTLAVASPRRALKILEDNPEDLFFDFRDNDQKSLDRKAATVQLEDRHFYKMLCTRMKGVPRKPPSSVWLNDAYADEALDKDLAPCLDMKNKDFMKFFKSHEDYGKAMTHIQERMDEFVKNFTEQYKKQNSSCELKIIELPQLFAGKIRQTLRSGFKPRMESAQSLFPNPSNGEVFGEKYILPDPVNATFRKEVAQVIADQGLTPVFLNTHFAHRLQGNLHCSEKTIRQCKPL